MRAATLIERLPVAGGYLTVTLSDHRAPPIVEVRAFSDITVIGGIQTSTGHGLPFTLDIVPSLIDALQKAFDEAERRGLAEDDQ